MSSIPLTTAKLHAEESTPLGPRVWQCSRPRTQSEINLDANMGRSMLSTQPCRLAGLGKERRHAVSVENDPRFDAAMRRVAEVARRHGKAAGFMATDAAWIDRAKAMGYTMLAGGTDSGLLQQAYAQLVERIGSDRG